MKVVDNTRMCAHNPRAHADDRVRRSASPPPEENSGEGGVQGELASHADAVKVSIGGAICGGKFRRIDADGDGALSQGELESARDTNNAAGRKTKFIDFVLENYSRLDTNGDEKLTLDEVRPNMVAHLRNRLRHERVQSEGESESETPAPLTDARGLDTTSDTAAATDPAAGEIIDPIVSTGPVVGEVASPIVGSDPAMGDVVNPPTDPAEVGTGAATAVPPTGEEIAAAIALPEPVTLEQLLVPPADDSTTNA